MFQARSVKRDIETSFQDFPYYLYYDFTKAISGWVRWQAAPLELNGNAMVVLQGESSFGAMIAYVKFGTRYFDSVFFQKGNF